MNIWRMLIGAFVLALGLTELYLDWGLIARIDLADPDSVTVGLQIPLTMMFAMVGMVAVAAGLKLLFTSRRKT